MVEVDIEKINNDFLSDARAILQILWTDMFNELLTLSKQGHYTPSLLVSKVRDYNRKWNKRAETEKYLLPDAFKTFVKKQLTEQSNFPPDFINALKYL